MSEAAIRAMSAAEVRPLRAELLRPGQAAERLVYPGDDEAGSLHLAALDGEELVGIASVMADPHPLRPAPGDWRVRGMATVPRLRRRGVGAMLLARCETHVRELGGLRLWCHARVPARVFYEHAGWSGEGDVFELEDIGPHVIMVKRLR